jgi:hypothetical protein
MSFLTQPSILWLCQPLVSVLFVRRGRLRRRNGKFELSDARSAAFLTRFYVSRLQHFLKFGVQPIFRHPLPVRCAPFRGSAAIKSLLSVIVMGLNVALIVG